MRAKSPHYLLLTATDSSLEGAGRWQFLLHRLDCSECSVEASDVEPGIHGQRLELLAVVRGLEALQQPSRVTLVTGDRYVLRGLRFGLQEWKAHGWRWERFGRWVLVKHTDLWQRMDRALQYHYVRGRHDRLGSWSVRRRGSVGEMPRWGMPAALEFGRSTSLRPVLPALVRRFGGMLGDSRPDSCPGPLVVTGNLG